MCRNIRTLHNYEPPATPEEVHAAAPCYDCEPATKAATGSSTTKAVKLRRQKGSAREVLLDSNLPFN